MQFFKTVDNENYLRLDDEEGASITLFKLRDVATIISIIVPKADRREGIGTALLAAAESELKQAGIRRIDVDFADTIPGISNFFKNVGYRVQSVTPIVSVNLVSTLSSQIVKRTILTEIGGAYFVPFSDFTVEQWDELLDIFASIDLRLTSTDMTHFFFEGSGVVYDDNEDIKSFVLCTESDGTIHVDMLLGTGAVKPQFILEAVRGMILGIINAGGTSLFSRLTMVAANPKIDGLLKKALDNKNADSKEQIGTAIYAYKEDIGNLKNDAIVEDEPDEDMEDHWRRELKKVPMQSNIGWKLAWYRSHKYVNISAEKNIDKSDKKSSKLSQKGKDDRNSLKYDDIYRINEDNIEEFAEDLDKNTAANISRIFYRGIANLTDASEKNVIVYELKNLEDEAETEAQIVFLSLKDRNSGEKLLSALSNEFSYHEVKRVYFELDELSDLEMELLIKAGFGVREQESICIEVKAKELTALPAAMLKPANDSITNIGRLTPNAFRRGITNTLFHGKNGALEDIFFLPKDFYENEISSCAIYDNKVLGMLLLNKAADDKLYVDLLFSAGGNSKMDIANMLRFSIRKILENYPDDTVIVIPRYDEKKNIVIKTIFPNNKGKNVMFGERRID